MKKQKNPNKDEKDDGKINALKPNRNKNKNRNIKRLGGRGLSLEAFANAKSLNAQYNPALIKKQREFYQNAKYVSKFKRKLKHHTLQNDHTAERCLQDEDGAGEGSETIKKNRKNKKGSYSLKALYEKKREEEDKARTEREAIRKAKEEKREKAEARRKAAREKMFKKTRHGQPIMKYRIEHLLEQCKVQTNSQ